MVFSSIIFLFLYLPAVLLVYYVMPRKIRNLFLFLASLVFYAWGEPIYTSIMLFSTVSDYTHGLLIHRYRENKRIAKLFLISAVTINLGLLCYFKYTGFFLGLLKGIPAFSSLFVPDIILPLGISFYTFQTMSYAIDVYRGNTPVEKNIISFGTYVTLFPQLIAGPIVCHKDVADQIGGARKETLEGFSKGVKLFVIGLCKKVLLANQMGMLWDSLRAGVPEGGGILAAWLGVISYGFQIYFDFSGYSDMACGLGNMLGFEFLKNFNYPYISQSITEFWRRWHISLGTWFKDYLYIPLGGNRKGKSRLFINLIIVWFLTGFWHGPNWNFIIWGLYFGVILILEKLFFAKFLAKAPQFVRHIYSLFLISVSWVIFFFENLHELTSYLHSMFCYSGTIISSNALAQVLSYFPLLLICIAASTPIPAKLYNRLRECKALCFADSIVLVCALLLCTASLVSQSYNPFLYFRF